MKNITVFICPINTYSIRPFGNTLYESKLRRDFRMSKHDASTCLIQWAVDDNASLSANEFNIADGMEPQRPLRLSNLLHSYCIKNALKLNTQKTLKRQRLILFTTLSIKIVSEIRRRLG